MKILCNCILIMLLSGCATQVPTAISKRPAKALTVEQVLVDIDKFSGAEVRWGGEIIKVENQAAQTWVEIVTRELSKGARPLSDSKSHGRFIASFSTFIDPAVYKVGASVTVVGKIAGERERMIGEYTYRFPLVLVSGAHLWPERVEIPYRQYHSSPWMYPQPWPYYYRPPPYYNWPHYRPPPHYNWPYYYRPYPFSR